MNPVDDTWEPRLHELVVSGPGLGDHSVFDHCDIETAAGEVRSDASVVMFKVIATGAEARVLLARMRGGINGRNEE